MKVYRSVVKVIAIKFDPDEPGIWDTLEGLGVFVNRTEGTAYLAGKGHIQPGAYLVFDWTRYGPVHATMRIQRSHFEGHFEFIEDFEPAAIPDSWKTANPQPFLSQ